MQPPPIHALRLGLLQLLSGAALAFDFHYESIALETGATLGCLIAGAPRNATAGTIVFLHGFPEGSWAWSGILATGLLDEFTLVAPDQRGYNRSSQIPGHYAITDTVADATALVRLFADMRGRVHLVAHDWGGAVAWWLAAAHPELLHSLTILNMAHPLGWISEVRDNPIQQATSAYVLYFVNPASTAGMTANGDAALKGSFAGEAWFDAAQEAAYTASWQVDGSVNAALDWYRENVRPRCALNCTAPACFNEGVESTFDAMPHNGTIPGRTLVLWGMKDTAFDNAGQLAFIPTKVTGRLNVTRFPSNSHWLGQEAPEAVARAILAWCSQP